MKMKIRYFTPLQIQRLIPYLHALLQEYWDKKKEFESKHDLFFLQELSGFFEIEGLSMYETEAKALEKELFALEKAVIKIKSLGCCVRSLDEGRLDFYSQEEGRPVVYSWAFGDRRLSTAAAPCPTVIA